MSRRVLATVPEPYQDVRSLQASVMALKELVEELTGQRGRQQDAAVTFGDVSTILGRSTRTWQPLSFINSWANYSAPYSPCGAYKFPDGLVILRGLCQGGSAADICTLPVGYRPGIRMLYAAQTSPNALCRIDVDPNGTVTHQSGSNGWISLNNICFLAEG